MTVNEDAFGFSANILKVLKNQGYTEEELIQRLIEVKSRIPHALEEIRQEALNGPSLTNQSLDEYLGEDEDENT